MKIIYIANIRIPTEKAHGVQITKMCEAFANAGNSVELVVPRRFNHLKEDPFEYYDVKNNFKIIKLPTLDLIRFGKIGYRIQSLSFAKFATLYSLFKKSDIIYSRDELPLWFLSFFKKNLVIEVHVGTDNLLFKRVIKKVKKIIVITQGLKDLYIKNYKINKNKIVVASDGVDLDKIDKNINKEEARKKMGLPLDKKIILYVGSLFTYDWKGVDVLFEASKKFGKDFIFIFVGGNKEEIKKIEKDEAFSNLMFVGHRPYRESQYYMKSADVLVLPNKKGDEVSEKYTSPMKLFEYMASGNPIVASNLPSIKEILNETNSILVEPNDSESLSNGIKKVLNNQNLRDNLVKQMTSDIIQYDWKNRVKTILLELTK